MHRGSCFLGGGTFRLREPFSDQVAPMDANSGEPWSEMDTADLAFSLACDGTIEDAAIFLCRDEDEVRQKVKELGLVESPAAPADSNPS
jgi:hypothetical protein